MDPQHVPHGRPTQSARTHRLPSSACSTESLWVARGNGYEAQAWRGLWVPCLQSGSLSSSSFCSPFILPKASPYHSAWVVPACCSSNTHRTADLGYASYPTCPVIHGRGSTRLRGHHSTSAQCSPCSSDDLAVHTGADWGAFPGQCSNSSWHAGLYSTNWLLRRKLPYLLEIQQRP